MSTYNSAVTIAGTLTCSLLTQPAIGNQVSGAMAYTDGHTATDDYVNVGTSATALHSALSSGTGFLLVHNPAEIGGAANTKDVTITLGDSDTLGVLFPGTLALLPVGAGVVYKGSVSTGSVTVGVTFIQCTANS